MMVLAERLVKFVISYWSVSAIRLLLVKIGWFEIRVSLFKLNRSVRSPLVDFVYVVDKSFVR